MNKRELDAVDRIILTVREIECDRARLELSAGFKRDLDRGCFLALVLGLVGGALLIFSVWWFF